MAKSVTVKEFFQKFPDDDTCLLHVMDLRHGREIVCPNPRCAKPTEFYKLAKRPAFSCKLCGHHIYPCAGTPFERTRTPLQLWFYAIYLFTTSRHGVPAKELQRQLDVTYKCAWRIGHEIRKFMGSVDGDDGLSGTVGVDEAYVGGNDHNTGRPGRDFTKTAIFGMVERGRDVMTYVVPNVRGETILPLIEGNVENGTLINSNEFNAYGALPQMGYGYETDRHRRKR